MPASTDGFGLGMWLLAILGFVLLAGAVAIVIDSIRRPRSAFGLTGRWPWIVVQAAFFGVTLYGMFVTPAQSLSAAMGLLTLVALVQQIAYLLRVVFPSPRRTRAASDDED
ncbi:MAG: hypothetical protein Q8K99_14000 [Actinomycetota bacterium]|nr:hypothetical protein [Actinomycetota bacterium]